MQDLTIKERAKKLINSESKSVGMLINYINADFVSVVKLVLKSRGRLVVTGIGKSANIGAKIVATMNSTGTPAIFMHAADAIHGDLGIVQPSDILLCISNSGNTPEIKILLPLIKNMGNTLIALVGNIDSELAKRANYVLQVTVEREACPLNLAPTNSTTAQLVMGDALAICLLEGRGFTSNDFAKYHPGGSLGKKLYSRVAGIMMSNDLPKVTKEEYLKKIIFEISSKRMGAVAVVDNKDKVIGIITDGDLRRMLEKNIDLTTVTASTIMTTNPIKTHPNQLAIEAYNLMEASSITQLLVVDNAGIYVGIIHLHDILKEGVV